MWRRFLGILAATVAAPYLVVFLWSLYGLLSGESVGLKEPLDLLKTIPLGTGALLMFGIPLLILAGICAALVHIVEQPTWRGPVLGGATLGLGFVAAIFGRSVEPDADTVAMLASGLCSGAICGWIYWAIALRRQPGTVAAAPLEMQGP